MTLTAEQRRNIATIERERRAPKKGWSKARDWTGLVGFRGKAQCSALDPDGRRCLGRSTYVTVVHEDPEIHSYDRPGWFAVPMCRKHAEEQIR